MEKEIINSISTKQDTFHAVEADPVPTKDVPVFHQNLSEQGVFLRATDTVPTDVPSDPLDKFRLYVNGTTSWLYIYDTINAVWRTVRIGNVPVVSGLQYYSTEYNNGAGGTTKTIDWDNGNCQLVTLDSGSTTTFTFTNGKAGSRYLLRLKQDATGSRTCVFPSSVKFAGGITPTLTTTATYTDIVTLYCDGTNYAGNYTLNFNI